ncbi:LUC7-domain-containing protein [Ascobolus immersus RN42]|uniref:LUC7-domain-containing protein n=1 Tax=Ascobolus immersus RN42 TaxID=1160509 RepID=A0A3N4ITD3_ASCIM|nr:LUC7-domain-containing protein [Ascobolus immersus RN42]
MAAEQRRLLEQLMGASTSTPTSTLAITDPKVCRSFIVGTCPHDLFTNTKFDLGSCPKIHSEALKSEYERKLPESKSYGFEWDYQRELQKIIDDCNRRIDAAQRRLEKTPEEIMRTNALLKTIGGVDKSIAAGLEEVEVLAESGAVGKALEEFVKVRKLRIEKEEKEKELKLLVDTSGPSGHQKLQVCDVCGAYLSRLDNDRRLADHFYGKMHIGYAQMRKTLKSLQEELSKRPPPQQEHGRYDDRHGGYGDYDSRDRYGGGGRGYGGRGGYRGGRRGGGGGGYNRY